MNKPNATARMEREQGERFVQLSQRCHQQNWAAVHALAEQILMHKREVESADESNHDEPKDSSIEKSMREGSVSISGHYVEVSRYPGTLMCIVTHNVLM